MSVDTGVKRVHWAPEDQLVTVLNKHEFEEVEEPLLFDLDSKVGHVATQTMDSHLATQEHARETQVVGGRERLEASLHSRYLAGTGLNRAANAEKRQLIDLKEEQDLSKHDKLPPTTDEKTLRNRAIERENIVMRAKNARTQLNADINLIGGSIITATSAVALFATNYIANMYGYGF